MNRIAFGIHNIFTPETRERCMANLKKMAVPQFGQVPKISASVLVPLCRVDNVPSLLYVVRAPAPAATAGEVTFPGGLMERHESPVQTALRAAEASIGLAARRVRVWGCAPAVRAGGGEGGEGGAALVVPVVGAVAQLAPADLNIKRDDLLEVFTVPIELLCDPRNQYHTRYVNGHVLPVFVTEEYKIWGMTAFITHAFLNSTLSKDFYRHDLPNKNLSI